MIELPKEEYFQVEENGKTVTYTTMLQKVKHVIGLDSKKPYIRHGKKFYRPYRNYWVGRDKQLDKLVDIGLMNISENQDGEPYWYSFNRKGLAWRATRNENI